jgi:hypothetical protein
MGCDIHAVFQAKRDGKWIDVPSKYQEDRHYMLFAWLADVRNGYGFAGMPTHTRIEPISRPRGLPEDFEHRNETHATTADVIESSWLAKYRKPDEPYEVWLGDHSHSWLTADEILAAPKPDGVLRTGIVDIKTLHDWDGISEPTEWCGGISGRDILVSHPNEITDKTTHVRIEWFSSGEVDYFVDEIRRLKAEHGEVRMVFGFDS